MNPPFSFEVSCDPDSDTILIVLVEQQTKSLLATLSPQECADLVAAMTLGLGSLGTDQGNSALAQLLPLFGAATPSGDGFVLQEVKMNNSPCVAQMRLTKQVARGIGEALLRAAGSDHLH